ncbi:MAG: hypothetical protein HUU20_29465 [Pirellulales bacterium]|nr:hypothetical protein [Pirellulales bacterium]
MSEKSTARPIFPSELIQRRRGFGARLAFDFNVVDLTKRAPDARGAEGE